MATGQRRLRELRPGEVRWVVYLLVVVAIAAWKFLPRPWKPVLTIQTAHYVIASTATPDQTVETGRVVELLYTCYSYRFGALPGFQRNHPKLKLLLYKDRPEFRHINPGLGWAEAFYRAPYCRAYYAAAEINPYHWMLHEAVHQLNGEVAHARLAKWLDEGLADYFATSRVGKDGLALGRIDRNTYPVWWSDEIATGPDLTAGLAGGSVIPLRSIITNHGGPSFNGHFNLYYLHWWTLTHFLFETDDYRRAAVNLVAEGGNLEALERLIGPVEVVERRWFQHARRIKAALEGNDVRFFRTGELPLQIPPARRAEPQTTVPRHAGH
jgi:hypothetical protein